MSFKNDRSAIAEQKMQHYIVCLIYIIKSIELNEHDQRISNSGSPKTSNEKLIKFERTYIPTSANKLDLTVTFIKQAARYAVLVAA